MQVRADTERAGRLPAATEYAVALLDPKAVFERGDLAQARFKRGPLGVVVQSGENTVVARATLEGREVAVRCHLNDDPEREARFRAVAAHLSSLGAEAPAAIGRAEYIKDGIFVGSWRPVSVMDWVRGENLHQFVGKRTGDRDALLGLAKQWLELTRALRAAEYVHGDPSHRNIVIGERGIALIDPDSAWVPALGETTPPESGNPAFQHPGRIKAKNSLDLDNFPHLLIYVSLRALAADPTLWKHSGSERLILDARDFREPHTSQAFLQMLSSPDPEVASLTAKLMQLCLGDIGEVPSLDRFVAKPEDTFERAQAQGGFVLPSHSRRASWLAAHLPRRQP
jgi:hypothetical protein